MDVSRQLLEQLLGRLRVGVGQPPRELQVDGERDQLLLRTVVKLALEAAALSVAGGDGAGQQPAELLSGGQEAICAGSRGRRQACLPPPTVVLPR